MRTFAELLREYTTRTGISDAELARGLGVRRQTVFRWKEGLVARPRDVQDVLRCAAKLRLTPQERDELLIAAGFPPEGPAPQSVLAGRGATTEEKPTAGVELSLAHVPIPARPVGPEQAGLAGGLVPGIRPVTVLRPLPQAAITGIGHRTRAFWLVAVVLLLAIAGALFLVLTRRPDTRYPVAGQGETLIVVGQFVNYAGGQQGYNVAGRVQEALKREVDAARLANARVVVWPETIPDAAAGQAVAGRARAGLVIWGEYDSGRVLAHFTAAGVTADDRRLEMLTASPAELSATINSALPEEVRYLALLTVGQVYMERDDYGRARATLTQALARPPADPAARATLFATLGYVYQTGQPADLDQAIDLYSQALALKPETVSLYNNRGIAYLRRGQPGDIERAITDLNAYVAALPDNVVAYVNRGAAYFQLGSAENLAHAVDDFGRAIALKPDAPEAYFNRGLAYLRLDEPSKWQADLTRVLALKPDHAGAYNAFCWAYALERQPEIALPYCERALSLDPTGPARDSRGIVYAELRQFAKAVDDLQAYLDALRRQDSRLYAQYAPRREAWIAALRAGWDPFDQKTLDELRQE
jgi:tetratricopeptide (TPR) repeat protein/transcriptional regulator with XRE-family HTH domain